MYGEIATLYFLFFSFMILIFNFKPSYFSAHFFDKFSDTDLQVKIIFQLVSNIKACSEKSHYSFQLKICLSHTYKYSSGSKSEPAHLFVINLC